MALLDDVIAAAGGAQRWSKLKRFTVHFSMSGALLSHVGHPTGLRDMVAEGCTQTQLVRFSGFSDSGRYGFYQPSLVTIESADGSIVGQWLDPLGSFRANAPLRPWEDLHLVFFCGYSLWIYLTTPFVLTLPDVSIKELSIWHEHGQEWRRLQATFPSALVTHSPQQTFYFDSTGLQRRVDHEIFGSKVAQYTWAHQTFGGIVIPTLGRSLRLQPDGTASSEAALFDIEIFDAAFG
jgi:hypothetical protein